MSISRRKFLEASALGVVASTPLGAAKGTKLPTRVLGRTGKRVSILAFGCGSRFLMYKDEEQAIAALERALELGITYFDTAFSYGDGLSEARLGKALAGGRREQVFVATKVEERDGDKALRVIEGSLRRLQTDHVDLLHIHSLSDAADLAQIEAPNGVLKTLYKLRDQKVARAIGITSHTDPAVLKTALERNDFDCTQMALNAAQAGMANTSHGFDWNRMAPTTSFQTVALPVAQKKKMGIIAMKVFAQEHLLGTVAPERLVQYSLSLPVTTAVVGMPKLSQIEANTATARAFKPLAESEMRRMSGELAEHKAAIERFFEGHTDS